MFPETPIYEDSTNTRLYIYEASDMVRMYVGDVLIFAGHNSSVGKRDFTLFGEHFIFDGESAEVLWETIRTTFRKNHNGLKWTKTILNSPFPEDTRNAYMGFITIEEFSSYPETTVRTSAAQDGSFPEDGWKRDKLFAEAIEKLAAVNEGAVKTPRLNFTHALLSAVREYGRCYDGLNSLAGLGLEDSAKIAREIVAQEQITENTISVVSYRQAAQAIVPNKFS